MWPLCSSPLLFCACLYFGRYVYRGTSEGLFSAQPSALARFFAIVHRPGPGLVYFKPHTPSHSLFACLFYIRPCKASLCDAMRIVSILYLILVQFFQSIAILDDHSVRGHCYQYAEAEDHPTPRPAAQRTSNSSESSPSQNKYLMNNAAGAPRR